jgi:hypothetical protein
MEGIRTVFAGTPLRLCIVGSGLVAIAAHLCLLAETVRRRAVQRDLRLRAEHGDWTAARATKVPLPMLEVVALLALLLVPAATVASVDQARAIAATAFSNADPSARARLLSDGWHGQLDSVALGILLEELSGGVGVVALSLALAARRQIIGLVRGAHIAERDPREAEAWAHIPSAETTTVLACATAFALLVILPALHGALSYCTFLTTRLDALAALAPADKLRRTGEILLRAQRRLHDGISASQLGLALAMASCGALLAWRSPARARRRWLGRPERSDGGRRLGVWGDAVWITVALLVISVTLSLVSIPIRAEGQMARSSQSPAGLSADLPAGLDER